MSSAKVHFVASAPRSGSTWLASALNQHPQIFATEQRLFGPFCEMWPNNNGQMAPRITFDAYARAVSVHYFHQQFAGSRQEFVDDLIRAYAAFLTEYGLRRSGKQILVDKVTPYPGTTSRVVGKINRFFPTAKIIQLIRDGRDVATSGTFDWLLKDAEGTVRHDVFVKREPNVRLTRFFDDDVLIRWANLWRESMEVFYSNKPALTVRYEDMLHNQADVVCKILVELNVELNRELAEACAAAVTFEKMTGRVSGNESPIAKQRAGTRGDWKKYFTRQDGELFQSMAGPELIHAGYESSELWWQELPEQLSIDASSLADGAKRS